MVVTCKFYHQLYCSTKLRTFQRIFLIIIYFHFIKQTAPQRSERSNFCLHISYLQ